MSQKFFIIRYKDIRKFLNADQKTALVAIFSAINAARAEQNAESDHLFVLNAADKYAQYALDEYIGEAQRDMSNGVVTTGNEGVAQAVKEAQRIRAAGVQGNPLRLPSLP